jgi:hypothetical protein
VRAFAIAISFLTGICSAQPSLPGCEARPEVRRELKEKLGYPALEKLKWVDRVAREYDVLNGLIARYPRELESYRRLIEFVDWDTGFAGAFPGTGAATPGRSTGSVFGRHCSFPH